MEGGTGVTKVIDKIRIISNNGVCVSVGEVDLKIAIDDFGREKYKRGRGLNEAEWCKLVRLAVGFLAKNYSFNLLSISAKSEAELKRRIEKKIDNWLAKNKIDMDKNIIDDIVCTNLDFLRKKKFVDDGVYVESMLRKYKNKSKKEIFFKLLSKGVDKNVINEYMVDVDDREKEAIRTCIVKKMRGKNELGRDEKRKLLASLYRKGFSIELAKTEIDELTNNG